MTALHVCLCFFSFAFFALEVHGWAHVEGSQRQATTTVAMLMMVRDEEVRGFSGCAPFTQIYVWKA